MLAVAFWAFYFQAVGTGYRTHKLVEGYTTLLATILIDWHEPLTFRYRQIEIVTIKYQEKARSGTLLDSRFLLTNREAATS